MARKEAVLDGFMEKWAAGGLLYKTFIQGPRVALKQMARGYRKTNNSTSFKVKKNVAKGLLGAGALAYGYHQITKAPKEEVAASEYQPPM